MKIILRTAAVAALIITTSCGKDTADAIADIFDEEVEQIESTVLDVENVTDNVLIEGGTKMEGMPPSANGSISLDVSDTDKTAFLDEGFNIYLSSDTDVKGAYIQFKSKDGSLSDSYYDVNVEINNSDLTSKSFRRRRVLKNNFLSISNKTDGAELDVDFNSNIEPGEFCYEICVYDAIGNISQPQEVCVKVEAWGGNSEAVGKWSLDKWFRDNDPDNIYLEGVNNCSSNIGDKYCQGVTFENIESESCTLIEYGFIELNADGTYTEKEKRIWTDTYKGDVSQNPCVDEATSEELLTYESKGKWSYLDDEEKFIFIAYYDEEVYDGESDSQTAEPGDGWIYYGGGGYDGEVTLSNGSLIVQSFEETTAHFKK